MVRSGEKIKFTTYDGLFDSEEHKDIQEKPTLFAKDQELYDFKDHPFLVEDNEDMKELVNDIKDQGILYPLIVRERASGGYEILAGHRRRFAGREAGLEEYPILIHNCSDEEAIHIMIGSNKYRTKIYPSELARAYKMELEATNRQGFRSDLHQREEDDQKDEEMGVRQKQLYARLTCLIQALLDMVDTKALGMGIAVELSYLTQEQQEAVLDVMSRTQKKPTLKQAQEIRGMGETGHFSKDALWSLFFQKTPTVQKLTIPSKQLKTYFPDTYSTEEMEGVIFKLLEKWKEGQSKKTEENLPGQIDIEMLEDGAYMPDNQRS